MKSNPYDPEYIMKRDNCDLETALHTIQKMKEKNAWNRGKTIQKSNPYDPEYIMKRDNCDLETALHTITKFKENKATSLTNFIKKYGEVDGILRYNEWKDKSLVKGWQVSKENGKSQSKFSMHYYIRKGYSKEESMHLALEYQYNNSPLHVQYYINKGKTINEARSAIRKIHDKKIGIDSYRTYLEKTTNMASGEITEHIKNVRGHCTIEKLGKEDFDERIAKTRRTFESKGLWVPLEDLSDYETYRREVWKYTNSNNLTLLENYNKRALAGTDNGYHLDHQYSISQGYINQVSPELIGSITNLKFISWEENVKNKENVQLT